MFDLNWPTGVVLEDEVAEGVEDEGAVKTRADRTAFGRCWRDVVDEGNGAVHEFV